MKNTIRILREWKIQLAERLQAEAGQLRNVPVETAILQQQQQTTAALLLGAPF